MYDKKALHQILCLFTARVSLANPNKRNREKEIQQCCEKQTPCSANVNFHLFHPRRISSIRLLAACPFTTLLVSSSLKSTRPFSALESKFARVSTCCTLRAATGVATSSLVSASGDIGGGEERTYSIFRDEYAVGNKVGAGRSFGALTSKGFAWPTVRS